MEWMRVQICTEMMYPEGACLQYSWCTYQPCQYDGVLVCVHIGKYVKPFDKNLHGAKHSL